MGKYDQQYFNACHSQAARDMKEEGIMGFHIPLPYGDYGCLISGYADRDCRVSVFDKRFYEASN